MTARTAGARGRDGDGKKGRPLAWPVPVRRSLPSAVFRRRTEVRLCALTAGGGTG